jgi:GT2 family glycosyltransferase
MDLPTIIIPVHDAYEVLRPCLESVARTVPDATVVVVDDASVDPRVVRLLEEWTASAHGRHLIRLPDNQGFVHAANHGMQKATGDVVLLNSDTLVTRDWLQALARCLASDQRIATATPWTNNGEIVSFPEFCVNNPVPANPDDVALAARSGRQASYPELPTAVGFCMAISRRALDAIGLFDAETFGPGYGEENDFSLRATERGMRNVLCDDAYVAHVGGASFGPLGLKPDEASMNRLLRKHPRYLEQVMAFIDADPLAVHRAALAAALTHAPA